MHTPLFLPGDLSRPPLALAERQRSDLCPWPGSDLPPGAYRHPVEKISPAGLGAAPKPRMAAAVAAEGIKPWAIRPAKAKCGLARVECPRHPGGVPRQNDGNVGTRPGRPPACRQAAGPGTNPPAYILIPLCLSGSETSGLREEGEWEAGWIEALGSNPLAGLSWLVPFAEEFLRSVSPADSGRCAARWSRRVLPSQAKMS